MAKKKFNAQIDELAIDIKENLEKKIKHPKSSVEVHPIDDINQLNLTDRTPEAIKYQGLVLSLMKAYIQYTDNIKGKCKDTDYIKKITGKDNEKINPEEINPEEIIPSFSEFLQDASMVGAIIDFFKNPNKAGSGSYLLTKEQVVELINTRIVKDAQELQKNYNKTD